MSNTGQESNDKICYKLLCNVFLEGGYSMITLGAALEDISFSSRAYITRLFYGTIEKSIQFDYIIRRLADKLPQKSVAVLIKMGLYMLRYMEMPSYAAVNKIVGLAKEVGKSGVSGFINAILRKSMEIDIPKDNLSVYLSYPEWVVNKLLKRYDKEFIIKNLSYPETPKRHIRRNTNKISKEDFEKKLFGKETYLDKESQKSTQNAGNLSCRIKNKPEITKEKTGTNKEKTDKEKSEIDGAQFADVQKTILGYLADADSIARLKPEEFTFQSLSSMLAVKAYLSGGRFGAVLDLCAAPGGKSIYLKELSPESEIVCCDVSPHRVELIKKYANRMGAKLEYACEDATFLNAAWLNKFDLVICDVPCSGLGVKTKPDILLNKHESNIASLSHVQYDILSIAANYVKSGGVLCYSTCTIFKEENEDIAERFLAENNKFKLCPIKDSSIEENEGMVNLYPYQYGSDFFFIARFIKD